MIKLKYNKWTILEQTGKDKWGSILVKCLCDCGNSSITRLSDLKSNKSVQCIDCGYKFKRKLIPFLRSPIAGKGNNYRHGMYGTPTYKSWSEMIYRCKDMGKNYKWYASRGIKVCEEWLKFDNFFKDMGLKPLKYYLDRIDNDLGYFKENCRWVDSKTNSRNRRCIKKKDNPV